MKFIADLHIHSHLSRACSQLLHPEHIYKWSQLKGLQVIATGDFTHPKWIAELKEKLIPAEPGLFQLKPELAKEMDKQVPLLCRGPVRFLLGVEISSIYKKGERVRKVHNLVFAPSFEVADQVNKKLDQIGNIKSDGRPILGLDSKKLLSLLLDTSAEAYLIPAHAWTPHFAVFGSESGFDSLEECFEDLTPHIFAIETGLSSDPPMNWRLSRLDNVSLISNSDAHSLEKLAREANVFETELSYNGIFDALKKRDIKRFVGTLEFFPEEGKYHVDGHRKCGVRWMPSETQAKKGICSKCETPVTVGVLHRIEKLADRKGGERPPSAAHFENIIPLKEVLAQINQTGPGSTRVDKVYFELLNRYGSELHILRELPLERLKEHGYAFISLALERMRKGTVWVQPGFDGEYGVISVIRESDLLAKEQLALF